MFKIVWILMTKWCSEVLGKQCDLLVSTRYSSWQWRATRYLRCQFALLEPNDFFPTGNQKMLHMDDCVLSEVGWMIPYFYKKLRLEIIRYCC